jgi:predicted transcriptional regulator
MKRDYFEKINDNRKEFTYIKGAAVGKFVKKNDLIIFYVDSDDKNPYGELVGYGKINEVYCGSPDQLWSKYEDRNPLFSEKDFKKFSSYRNEVIAISFEDYKEIEIIRYDEFLQLFQEVIFTKELGNMYVSEDFVRLFISHIVANRERLSQPLSVADSIIELDINPNMEKHVELEEQLLIDLVSACQHLQGRAKAINSDENSRNSIITLTLTAYQHGYTLHDQSLYGRSATGKSSGEVDIRFEDNAGNTISICEAFILKSLDTNVIDKHLTKIFGYDSNGLNRNYIVIYAESNRFIDLWSRYLRHIQTISFEYPLAEDIEDVSSQVSKCADIKVGLVKHERNGRFVEVYHIFVNMNI